MNKSKKVGAAVTLAAMFAGGLSSSSSAMDIKSLLIGAGTAAAAILGADVVGNKSLGNFIKEKTEAPEGLWKKYFNKGEEPAPPPAK